MDADLKEAFGSLSLQVTGVETRLNTKIEAYHGEFLNFKRGVVGPTDPPSPPSPLVTSEEVDEHARELLNGAAPPSTLKARMATGEEEARKLRSDVDRLLALQEQQSKEQGSGRSFFAYLLSRSGRKLVLQVITAVIVLYGYVESRVQRPPAGALPVQAAPR